MGTFTQANVDSLRLDGTDTINNSTDTALTIDANGTGAVNIARTLREMFNLAGGSVLQVVQLKTLRATFPVPEILPEKATGTVGYWYKTSGGVLHAATGTDESGYRRY